MQFGKRILLSFLILVTGFSFGIGPALADTGFVNEHYEILSDSRVVATDTKEEGLYQLEQVKFDDGVALDLYRMPSGDVLYMASAEKGKGGLRYLRLRIFAGETQPVQALDYKNQASRTGLDLKKITLKTGRYPSQSLIVGERVFLSTADALRPSINGTFAILRSDAVGLSIAQEDATDVPPGTRELIISLPAVQDKLGVQWGFLGAGPIFATGKIDQSALEAADLNLRRKIFPQGILDPTNIDYIPGGTDIYWLNPALYPATAAMRPENAKHPLLDAVARLGTRMALANQNELGYWYSSPGSRWLQADYGIEPGYYDTRFSTDAGMLLLGAYERYQDEKALAGAKRYAAYLIKHMERGIKTQTGVLLPDYWHDSKELKKIPHVSLNHQLTEMNYLYRLFILTKDKEYLETARALRRGIDDTARQWVKPDGDLWYGRTAEGEYIRPDYPTLTFYDLQKAEYYVQQAEGFGDWVITDLRKTKQAYMDKMQVKY